DSLRPATSAILRRNGQLAFRCASRWRWWSRRGFALGRLAVLLLGQFARELFIWRDLLGLVELPPFLLVVASPQVLIAKQEMSLGARRIVLDVLFQIPQLRRVGLIVAVVAVQRAPISRRT